MRGLLLLLVVLTAAACPARHEEAAAGVRIVQVFARGADASSPFVVWLHGRGGRPERFESFWRDFPGKIEVALPQGTISSGFGWAWFDWPPGLTDEELSTAIGAAEEKLWRAIHEAAHGRKVIVGGFSQGAVLTYLIAARHPDDVIYAFPIAGMLPMGLLPGGHGKRAPVFGMHGTDDDVIPADYGRATVAAFVKDGGTAELLEQRDTGHTMTDEMRKELVTRIGALVVAPP